MPYPSDLTDDLRTVVDAMLDIAQTGASELMLVHPTQGGVTGRLELVLVDRGVTAGRCSRARSAHDLEGRRVGWDDKQPVFRPTRHAGPDGLRAVGPTRTQSRRGRY
jgi:hypothetical protein